MKKIKLLLLLAIISSSAMVSCVDDDVKTYTDGSRIVGFKNTDASYIFTSADTDPVTQFEPIDLIGGANGTASDTPIVIKYEVDPASTAIEGTEFNFADASRQVTIAPGADFAKLEYTVIPTNLTSNITKTLILHLTEVTSANGVILEEQKTVTILIAKCESDLAGAYNLTVTREDNNAVYSFLGEIITSTGTTGEYVTSSSGPYGNGALSPAPRDGFIFSDVCQSISIPEQNLGDYYSNLLEGDADSGSVILDPISGEVVSITMHYSIRGFTTGVAQRFYTAVYTKI